MFSCFSSENSNKDTYAKIWPFTNDWGTPQDFTLVFCHDPMHSPYVNKTVRLNANNFFIVNCSKMMQYKVLKGKGPGINRAGYQTRWCSIFQSIWKSLTDHLWVSFNNLRTDFPPKQFNNCLLMLFSCTLLGSATMNTFATTSTVAFGPGLPSWRAQSMGSSCQSLSWPHSSSTHSS